MLISHDREKLIQAIVYFASNTQACGKIKLFKLLYLLDFESFKLTGRSVTGMEYRAWKLGPVPNTLIQEWDELPDDLNAAVRIEPERVIDHVRETVHPRVEFNPSHFTKRELGLMAQIAGQYEDTLSARMIDVTHAENGAWARVWNEGQGSFEPIPYDLALPDTPDGAEARQQAREYESTAETLGRH